MGCADSKAGATSKKPRITVEYLNLGHGWADPTKMLFAHANVDYEYIGHTPAEWGELKK